MTVWGSHLPQRSESFEERMYRRPVLCFLVKGRSARGKGLSSPYSKGVEQKIYKSTHNHVQQPNTSVVSEYRGWEKIRGALGG